MRRMYSENQVKTLAKESVESGAVNLPISQIVDEEGHNRFIKGDIEAPTMVGIEFTYLKWSLSGTHIMFVIAGRAEANSVFTNSTFTVLNLPEWIKSQLIPIFRTSYIDLKTFTARADEDLGTTNLTVSVQKSGENIIINALSASTSITKESGFRFQFDFLIE